MTSLKTDLEKYTAELHKKTKEVRDFKRVRTYYPNDIWSSDLVFMRQNADNNKEFQYILTIIDIYSRYAWAFPLHTKSADEIYKVFKNFQHLPDNLWVDEGTEFFNKKMKSLGMNIYHTYSKRKAVFVERFNRTLKTSLFKYFSKTRNDNFLEILPKILKQYNNSIHSAIGEKPVEVYSGKVKSKESFLDDRYIKKPDFKEGDYVRLKILKKTFEKGFTQKWTKEVFEIDEIDYGNPHIYYVKDLKGEPVQGGFYKDELQHTELEDFALIDKIIRSRTKNRRKEYLVSFDGYSSKFNEWVSESKLKELRDLV